MINRRKLTNITALLAIASIITGTLFLERAEKNSHQQEHRSLVLNQLSSVRAKLEGIINSTLLLTRGLVAHVATNPDITVPEFHKIARELLPVSPHILNIGLAKDNVITHMYPVEGNEAAIGLRYMDNPKQRAAVLRAIEIRNTVVAGPVKLVQGGVGFISRTPIFITLPGGEPGRGEYWGLASIVINMASLFESAGISTDISSGLRIALRGKDGLGEKGALFFGDEIVFRSDPVFLDVTLPEGSWQIAAIPAKGWDIASSEIAFLRFACFLIAGILGISILLFGRLSEEMVRRKIKEASAESDRKAKNKFEDILLTSPAVTYSCSIENNKIIPTFASSNIEHYFGYREGDVIEEPDWWVNNIHPDDKKLILNKFSKALFHSSKDSFTHEYRFKNNRGAYIWVRDGFNVIRDEKGAPIKIVGSWMDISERKESEEMLRILEKALETTDVGITIADLAGKIIYSNPADAMMHGYRKDELLGRDVANFAPEEIRQHLSLKEVSKANTRRRESINIRSNGTSFPVYLISDIVADASGEPLGLITICEDITEKKKVEDELKTSREQLRNLATSLQSAREEERKRIAIEVHDELGQSLTALKIDLSLLRKKLPGNMDILHEKTESMLDIVSTTLQSVKRISKELRPEILDELGLEAAIEWQTKEFSSRSEIQCDAEIEPLYDNTAKETSLVLFRVFQEAMTNILRHAEATRVKIKLRCKEENIFLTISDNGIGIDKSKISGPMSTGLIGMNERVRSVGGVFKLRGISGVGTTVKVTIPGKVK